MTLRSAAPGIDGLVARVVDRTIELAAVPGPPLDESDRAAVVAGWWEADGLTPTGDEVGNVWARLRAGSTHGAVVVAAHLDTVFDRSVAHGVVREDGGDRGPLLRGPGVGDDTVALAALSILDQLLPDTTAPVWILATVGEEGMGDLRGARAATADPPEPLRALLAVEGNFLGRVAHVAVGSVRARITVTGPGGHAWERADAPSAVHAAAELVAALAALAAPGEVPKRAVNVGRIEGGEAINARAIACTFDVDLRSDDPGALAELDRRLGSLSDDVARRHGVTVERAPLGHRPAGRREPGDPVVAAAVAGLASVGRTAELVAASTDANAALAAGVDAVAIGITEGAGEHTVTEWIALTPIGDGLRALAATVTALAGTATTDQEGA